MTLLQTCYTALGLHPASLSFLFLILPVLLFVYYLFPARYRPLVLLGESLVFLWFAQPFWLPLLLGIGVADLALLWLMDRLDAHEKYRRLCAAVGVCKSVAALCVVMVITQRGGQPWPLGVPVFALSSVSVMVDAFRRRIPRPVNPVPFGLYYCFFPRLYAGPMIPYPSFLERLSDLRMRPRSIASGAGLYIQGAFKMSLLGRLLYQDVYLPAAGLPEAALVTWLQVLALALSLYYLLSGFADMAQGLARTFGFELPQNFYYPYQSRNVEDYLDRFHRSFTVFFRDVVPGGNSDRTWVRAAHALACCLLVGLWFGLRPGCILWGVYLGLFVLMERYLYPWLVKNFPTLFSRVITLAVMLVGIAIMAGSSPAESFGLVRGMFRPDVWFHDQVLYLLTSNWLLLLASCFLATNAASLAMAKLRRAVPAVHAVILSAADAGILFLFVVLSI